MEWVSLASTIVGAGIATASAGILDQRRWRRERGDQNTERRRSLYVSYLAALASARHACRVALREPDPDPLQRGRAARETALSTLTGRQMTKKENPSQIPPPAGRFGASFAESEVKIANHLCDHLMVRQN